MPAVPVQSAQPGDPFLRGRSASTREEWEAAREADVADLNRHLAAGGEVDAYVAPLWSNGDIERCLRELRGFDEARVYVELPPDDGMEEALAAVAESEWAGAAFRGGDVPALAAFLHAAASLELPLYLEEAPEATRALALAIGEDLTPREIEAVLQGEDAREPDVEAWATARELLRE